MQAGNPDFIFKFILELEDTPGVRDVGLDCGLVIDGAGNYLGREGMVRAKCTSLKRLSAAIDLAAAKLRKPCRVSFLQMWTRKLDPEIEAAEAEEERAENGSH